VSHRAKPRDFGLFVVGDDLDMSDTLVFASGDLDTPGAVLRITVRDQYGSIVGELSTLPGGGISALSATQYSAVFAPAVTALWPPDTQLKYDTELSFEDTDEGFTQWYGEIPTAYAITRAISAIPELEELTIDDEPLEIDGEQIGV
jgi:hypothetical protein